MEKSNNSFIYAARRRRKTVRIIKINRVIALILFITIIFCGVITFFAIKDNDVKKIDSKSFYFIQMGVFTSSGDALAKSLELKNSGASGYIVNDGVFRVMATVFVSKSDALSVEKKLLASGKECSIHTVKTKIMVLGKYDSASEIKAIRSLLEYPLGRFFTELQAQDIALASGETTDSASLLAAANLRSELTKNHEVIMEFLSKYPADKTLNSIEKVYREIKQAFNNYLPQTELTVGTNIKSILCASIEYYLNEF